MPQHRVCSAAASSPVSHSIHTPPPFTTECITPLASPVPPPPPLFSGVTWDRATICSSQPPAPITSLPPSAYPLFFSCFQTASENLAVQLLARVWITLQPVASDRFTQV